MLHIYSVRGDLIQWLLRAVQSETCPAPHPVFSFFRQKMKLLLGEQTASHPLSFHIIIPSPQLNLYGFDSSLH